MNYNDYIVNSNHSLIDKLNFFSKGYKKLIVIDNSKITEENYMEILKYVVENILNNQNVQNAKMYVGSKIMYVNKISFNKLQDYIGENIIIFVEE
jgi:hypothetical protein